LKSRTTPPYTPCGLRGAGLRRYGVSSVQCLALACLMMILSATQVNPAQSERLPILFFSSETNVNNYKSLKMEFDEYLLALGPYELQPFSDRAVFEEHLKEASGGLVLLSAWHYRNIFADYSLKPLLAGARGGSKYQRAILVAKGSPPRDDWTTLVPIACAASIQHARSLLGEMAQNKTLAESMRILTVPKDVDALLSVSLGMSRSALASERSLEDLRGLSSGLHAQMKIIAHTNQSLFLVLAGRGNSKAQSTELLRIVGQMASNPKGKELMGMIGLDAWEELSLSDILQLESRK